MGETPDDGASDETMADTRPVEARGAPAVLVGGRYEVKRLLGEGGMGEVHECRDVIMDRAVALKMIRRDRSRRQLEPRLIREACVQAQVEHPSIVPVYEIGRDGAGVPYFTMRKLVGTPLDEVIELKRVAIPGTTADMTEKWSRHKLLTAFSQICLAVECAHTRGVLHRDLKPSNIMLGEFGEVYVLDWGLAKLAPVDESSRVNPDIARSPTTGKNQTVAGTTLGTPGYMAPEQIGGGDIDGRADVFALGAVLFEILTREPLLDDAAIEARLRPQTAKSSTWDARPSVRAPARQVPPEFDRICQRATARDPSLRYPSARALHDEVEAYLDGERDVGLRTRLAASHLARAEAACTTDRDEALREVNRALALAPEDRRAIELLVELLDTPSAPEQARAEVEAEGILRHHGSQPFVLLFTIPWLTVYPLYLARRGVDNVGLAVLPIVAWAAATIATFVARHRKTQSRVFYPVIMFMLAIATSAVVTGPLLLIPSLATAALATHTLAQPRALRRVTLLFAAIAVLAPMLFLWLGLWTPYTFVDDATFILHGVTREMQGKNLAIFLTMSDVAFVMGVAIFATRFRAQIDHARTAKILTAWQLSKLLPPAVNSDDEAPPSNQFDTQPLPPYARPALPLASTFVPKGEDTASPLLVVEGPRYVDSVEIARGSTTRVERVRDRIIGRDVAMKRTRPSKTGDGQTGDGARDIRREALFQASLEHPFIPPIYEVGHDEDGPWFTTKLVRGKRLSELLKADESGSPHGRHERLTALAKVCLTIEFAHARGILHAALYPDNIMLGEFGEVYVLGWSHAKRHVDGGPVVTPSGPLSHFTSRPLAAIEYLAPEQAGQAGDGGLDARTDVYALGALLFAVATGKPPSFQVALPDRLAEICRRAMAPDPKDRYPSARKLHDALEAVLASDRDEELRRQLASERLAKAEKRASRALANDDEAARVATLRELGRALALAPERSRALRLLARLLQSQPRRLPDEVVRDLERQIWDLSKKSAPTAAIVYVVSFLVAFPIYSYFVGVRDPVKTIAVIATWAVAALTVWGQTLFKRESKNLPKSPLARIPLAALSAWIAIATTSLVLGPWLMVPSLAITVTMVYALALQARWRFAVILLGGASVLVPALPVLFDASDVARVGGMTEPMFVIHGADYHPPVAYLVVLVVVNLASVLAAGAYAAQYRDLLDGLEAENRAKVHALSRLM